jgi:hypothetical protein
MQRTKSGIDEATVVGREGSVGICRQFEGRSFLGVKVKVSGRWARQLLDTDDDAGSGGS